MNSILIVHVVVSTCACKCERQRTKESLVRRTGSYNQHFHCIHVYCLGVRRRTRSRIVFVQWKWFSGLCHFIFRHFGCCLVDAKWDMSSTIHELVEMYCVLCSPDDANRCGSIRNYSRNIFVHIWLSARPCINAKTFVIYKMAHADWGRMVATFTSFRALALVKAREKTLPLTHTH